MDVDVKKGGNQFDYIDYDDQDPRIHRLFVDELTRTGLAANMPQLASAASG